MNGTRMLSSRGRLFSMAFLTAAGSLFCAEVGRATNSETVSNKASASVIRFNMIPPFSCLAGWWLFFCARLFEQTDNFSAAFSPGQFQSRLAVFGFDVDLGPFG